MELTPLKAIKEKCLDCCCGDRNEVKKCTAEGCPLHFYRFGKNPNRKMNYTDEQRKEIGKRLHKNKEKNND